MDGGDGAKGPAFWQQALNNAAMQPASNGAAFSKASRLSKPTRDLPPCSARMPLLTSAAVNRFCSRVVSAMRRGLGGADAGVVVVFGSCIAVVG